jgi:hypothetical protein
MLLHAPINDDITLANNDVTSIGGRAEDQVMLQTAAVGAASGYHWSYKAANTGATSNNNGFCSSDEDGAAMGGRKCCKRGGSKRGR